MSIVAVSNRVPKLDGAAVAGGLAVGLQSALEARGGLWLGWSGQIAEDAIERDCRIDRAEPFTLATIDFTEREHLRHYQGFCNRALWPLLHGLCGFMHFDREDLAVYREVNARFARHVAELVRDGDLVWVHDYHLMLLGRDLRAAGVEAPIGHFLHVPFPEPEVFRRLPCHRELVDALTAFDLLGFQTRADAQNFRAYVLRYLGAIAVDDGSLLLHGRKIRVGAFPIGIDVGEFARLADSAETRRAMDAFAPCFSGKLGVIGADRLDYTKGIGERMAGFERVLETAPEYCRRAFLVQIAAPSREAVPEYAELKRSLEEQSGRINARHGDVDWTPVRFLNQTFDHARLTALYRLSRVGLITPVRDGMNMVAKEYVAAQDERDPGVLVLSHFAGAAAQMPEALLVDPRDTDGIARALRHAFEMPLDERRGRWQALIAGVRREDIQHWQRSFIEALGRVPRSDRRVAVRSAHADFRGELVVLKAWEHRDQFRPGTNMRAWLFTILRNNHVNDIRRSRPEVEDVDGAAAEGLTQKASQDGHVALEELRQALARLPEQQREALLLVAACGFSHEEAARICSCRPGTIKSRMHRGRETLARLLRIEPTPLPRRPLVVRLPEADGRTQTLLATSG